MTGSSTEFLLFPPYSRTREIIEFLLTFARWRFTECTKSSSLTAKLIIFVVFQVFENNIFAVFDPWARLVNAMLMSGSDYPLPLQTRGKFGTHLEYLSMHGKFSFLRYRNCRNSRPLMYWLMQTHEFIIYEMRQRARAGNLTICLRIHSHFDRQRHDKIHDQ